MKYENVFIDALGYELPPNVITSDDLEKRLEPVYQALRLNKGQLEAITGIRERRFWDRGFRMSTGAIMAGRKALAASSVKPQDIGMLIYGGVCRDHLEPATACAVADGLGIGPQTKIYDVSNACQRGVKRHDPVGQRNRTRADTRRHGGFLRIRPSDRGTNH